jgi:hypothetical protein
MQRRLAQIQQNNHEEGASDRQQALAIHTIARRQQARNARQELDSPRTRYELFVKCVTFGEILKSFEN